MTYAFMWYRITEDGRADCVADSPAIRALIDRDGRNWYGNIEGAIINGGVRATAFKRKTEMTYDAAHWLATRELKPAGEVTTTEITAERA